MIRDELVLDTLISVRDRCSVIGEGGDPFHKSVSGVSVVALVSEIKPLRWIKQRHNGRPVEYFEFYVSDDTLPYFKFKCWGSSAMFVAAKVKIGCTFLFDRFEAVSRSEESYGAWSTADTSLVLLATGDKMANFDNHRFKAVCKRSQLIIASMKPKCINSFSSTHCHVFKDIYEGRLMQVDICISFPVAPGERSRVIECTDMVGAKLSLEFGSSSSSQELKSMLTKNMQLVSDGMPKGPCKAWLAARNILVSWTPHGHIRSMVTSYDTIFDLFCFEWPSQGTLKVKGPVVGSKLLVLPPKSAAARSEDDHRNDVYLSWKGFCQSMRDKTKLSYLADKRIVITCAIKEIQLPSSFKGPNPDVLELVRVRYVRNTSLKRKFESLAETREPLVGMNNNEKKLSSKNDAVEALYKSVVITIGQPSSMGLKHDVSEGSPSQQKRRPHRDVSFLIRLGDSHPDGVSSNMSKNDIPPSLNAVGAFGSNGCNICSSAHTFVEDVIAPTTETFTAHIENDAMERHILRGIPASLLLHQTIMERGLAQFGDGVFDFKAACLRVVRGLMASVDFEEVFKLVLRMGNTGDYSEFGYINCDTRLLIEDILPAS